MGNPSWGAGYHQGESDGYNSGYEDGSKEGYSDGFNSGGAIGALVGFGISGLIAGGFWAYNKIKVHLSKKHQDKLESIRPVPLEESSEEKPQIIIDDVSNKYNNNEGSVLL